MVFSGTTSDLIEAKIEPGVEEIKEIINRNIKQANTPESFSKEIFARVLSAIEYQDGEIAPLEELSKSLRRESVDNPPPPPLEEKKEYEVYSHLYAEIPYPVTKTKVDNLKALAMEDDKAFDILFNYNMREIIVHNKKKCFIPERGKSAGYQMRLLRLFLKNVGGFVSAKTIAKEVWCDLETEKNTIQQQKRRLIVFTEKTIKPFVKWDNTSDIEKGQSYSGYIIKECDRLGNKFKYCLIEKKSDS